MAGTIFMRIKLILLDLETYLFRDNKNQGNTGFAKKSLNVYPAANIKHEWMRPDSRSHWSSTLDNISHGWLEWRGKVLLCCDARVLAQAGQPPWWPGWPIRHRDVTGRGVQCSVFSVVVTLVNISTPGPGPSIVWSTCQHVTQVTTSLCPLARLPGAVACSLLCAAAVLPGLY